MPLLYRVKSRWSGFSGAPGYTVLHFRDFNGTQPPPAGGEAAQAQGAVTRVFDFFTAVRTSLPTPVRVQVEGEVEVIEDTTGELINSFSTTAPAVVAGSGGTQYSAPVGAVVNWRTAGIRNGRRIRGRSFLVPLANGSFSTDGGLIPAIQTSLQTAASALAASTGTPDLHVYARPTGPGASDGVASPVTAAQVPSLAAVLRSRRD